MTAAELRVAAARAATYPPGNARWWGADPKFRDLWVILALEAHPELLESG